ncbi:MAG: MmpS family transport accessory protein [Mycobacterium sp.]
MIDITASGDDGCTASRFAIGRGVPADATFRAGRTHPLSDISAYPLQRHSKVLGSAPTREDLMTQSTPPGWYPDPEGGQGQRYFDGNKWTEHQSAAQQPAAPAYQTPQYVVVSPKKRPVWPWVLGGIFLVIFLTVGACVAFVGGVASNIDKETKREVEVIYAVSGSGRSVAITYSGRDFNTAQETAVSLPWNKSVTIDGLGKTVSLTATNDMDGGTITCQITANGKTIAEQTSSGPFATASCIGNAGDT